jgi:hypothetical protein
MYPAASRLSKMWLPEVITSIPAAKSCSACWGVTEKPPETFSAFITARSTAYCSRKSWIRSSTATRPGRAITSPIIKTLIGSKSSKW